MKIRNEAAASFLVTFGSIKTKIKVLTANADKLVGHSYQTEPSGVGAVYLGSHVKGAIMHGVVGSECSVHPTAPPQESFISACQLHAHPLGFFTQLHRKLRTTRASHRYWLSLLALLFLSLSLRNVIFWMVETSQYQCAILLALQTPQSFSCIHHCNYACVFISYWISKTEHIQKIVQTKKYIGNECW